MKVAGLAGVEVAAGKRFPTVVEYFPAPSGQIARVTLLQIDVDKLHAFVGDEDTTQAAVDVLHVAACAGEPGG